MQLRDQVITALAFGDGLRDEHRAAVVERGRLASQELAEAEESIPDTSSRLEDDGVGAPRRTPRGSLAAGPTHRVSRPCT